MVQITSRGLLVSVLYFGMAGAALAQTGGDVHGGLASNNSAMSGANIDVANGINANGTPRQQSPGTSMTVGAGNSTMIPGVSGPAPARPGPEPIPTPQQGIVTPTINGQPAGQ